MNDCGSAQRIICASRVAWVRSLVVTLVVCCPFKTACSQPPPLVSSESNWGGTLVPSAVPHQPSSLLVQPSAVGQPLILDDCAVCDPALQPTQLSTELVPAVPAQPQLPPGTRAGVFQKLFISGTWLPQLSDDSLGVSNLRGGVVLGFPFLRRDTPLLVTPRFGVNYLDGTVTPDLPPRLYDAEVEFRHLRKFGQGPWAMDAAVTVGYYSDFERSSSDAVRVSGRGIGVYEPNPGTKWLLGVAYVNRSGLRVFPVVGVIHEDPDSAMRWDLIFPRPRVSWRLPGGIPGSGDERWFYVGGEFGGGIWTIERPVALIEDELTYSDVRVLVGYERKIIGGLSRRLEAGYVFARDLEFASATPDVSLDDTLFVRMGLSY